MLEGANAAGGGAMDPKAAVHVSELDAAVTEAALFAKFSPLGQVDSIRVCRDFASGASLGYAYIYFRRPEDAQKAIAALDGTEIKDRPMRVMRLLGDPSKTAGSNVFIKNLDKSTSDGMLYETFHTYGNIFSCKVAKDESGVCKGYGFVNFSNEAEAKNAIEKANGMIVNGKKLYVGMFIPRKEREAAAARGCTEICVRDLWEDWDEEKLRESFQRFGCITGIKVIGEEESKGIRFGMVTFADSDSAQKAVLEMNGRELNGKFLAVEMAWGIPPNLQSGEMPPVPLSSSSPNPLLSHSKSPKASSSAADLLKGVERRNLYVKNLDDTIDDERLQREFARFGSITSAKIMTENGRSKGFGFVCFSSPEEATKAVTEMNGRIVGTKPLYVALAQKKEDRKAYLASQYVQRMKQVFHPGANYYVPAMQQPVYYNPPPQQPSQPQQQPQPQPQQPQPPQQMQPQPQPQHINFKFAPNIRNPMWPPNLAQSQHHQQAMQAFSAQNFVPAAQHFAGWAAAYGQPYSQSFSAFQPGIFSQVDAEASAYGLSEGKED